MIFIMSILSKAISFLSATVFPVSIALCVISTCSVVTIILTSKPALGFVLIVDLG